jgi:predicted O-linked N-acetylglucosamine transferase (SPINDLY family)
VVADSSQQLKKQIAQLVESKRYHKALELARKAVTVDASDAEVWFALAQLQIKLDDTVGAIESLFRICEFPSAMYKTAIELGLQLCKEINLDHRGASFAQLQLQFKPNDAQANYFLGKYLFDQQAFLAARPFFEKSLQSNPSSDAVFNFLCLTHLYTGDADEALELLNEKIESGQFGVSLLSLRAVASNYSSRVSDSDVFRYHKELGASYSKRFAPLSIKTQLKKRKKIAFVSSDFYRHSVSYFFKAILQHYSKDRFEIYCYQDNNKSDEVTDCFKQMSDHWIESCDMSDQGLAEHVRNVGIDILVDLVGHFGKGRLNVFASRAAPVQVTYLGYPNTTGLSEVDYRITDSWSDPLGLTDQYYSEKLVRLDGGFLCYSQLESVTQVKQHTHLQSQGRICFGSFNSFLKLTKEHMRLWVKILNAVPNATLLIKTKPLVEGLLRDRVKAFFESNGIASGRLDLRGWSDNVNAHLSVYDEVDIHLDSFPYNGTTTTVESLRQGVPVITLKGDSHRSRVGYSLLSQVGLKKLVASTEDQYVSLAVQLAEDPEALQELKETLRERVNDSLLMEPKAFTRKLETAFDFMLKQKMGA